MAERPLVPIEILLVEDSPDDVQLTLTALGQITVPHHVTVVGDGVEAMAFLRREGEFLTAPRPHLIMLDINLPKKRGNEVLAEVKDAPELKHIPVIMMSSSTALSDIEATYALHANCYIAKPIGLDRSIEVIRRTAEFWLSIAELPIP